MLSFHVKFVQIDRRTDKRITVKQYAPHLSIRGHKKKSPFIDGHKSLFFIVPANKLSKQNVLKKHSNINAGLPLQVFISAPANSPTTKNWGQ